MIAQCLIIILSICSSSETVKIPLITDNYSKLLFTCIEPLIKDFDNHQATSLYYSIPSSVKYNVNWRYLFKMIGSTTDLSATVLDSCSNATQTPTPTVYMLFIYASSHDDIMLSMENQLKYISCNEVVWKPEVFTIAVVILAFHEDPKLVARTLIEFLWKLNVYDCSIIIIREDGQYSSIYSADPFHKLNKCGHQLTVIDQIYNCLDPEDRRNAAITLILPNRFPNCTLKVSVNMQPPFAYEHTGKSIYGSDIGLIRLFEDKFGVKSEIIIHEKQVTTTQLLKQFSKRFWKHNDIALGGYPMMQDFLNTVVYCRINAEHRYYFYLSNVEDITGWQLLIRAFLPGVWYTIGVIMFASIIILYLIKFRIVSKPRKRFTPFLLILGFMVQQPRKIPKDNVLRFYLFTIIPLFYLIGSLYTSLLHSFTINPPSGRKILSLDELYHWNMTASISPENFFFLRHIIEAGIKPKSWKFYSDINKAMIDITNGDITLLESNLFVNFVLSKIPYDIYRLNDLVCSFTVALVLPKGSLFESKISTLINKINENGLYSKWLRYHTYNVNRKHLSAVNTKNKISSNVKVLTLTDLAPVFILLINGYTISLIVFIIELLINKIKMNKN